MFIILTTIAAPLALIGVVLHCLDNCPEGYEDDDGFWPQ